MIFPGFPGVPSFFQVFQVEWEPCNFQGVCGLFWATQIPSPSNLTTFHFRGVGVFWATQIPIPQIWLFTSGGGYSWPNPPELHGEILLLGVWRPPCKVNKWNKALVNRRGIAKGNILRTRMHSSRMRTVRSSSRLLGGRCLPGEGGGVSQHALGQNPSPSPSPWTEWLTGVKTLPFRNFVCGR